MSKHKDGANHKTGHKKDKRKREAEGAHAAVPIQAAGVEPHEKIKLPKRQSRGDSYRAGLSVPPDTGEILERTTLCPHHPRNSRSGTQ